MSAKLSFSNYPNSNPSYHQSFFSSTQQPNRVQISQVISYPSQNQSTIYQDNFTSSSNKIFSNHFNTSNNPIHSFYSSPPASNTQIVIESNHKKRRRNSLSQLTPKLKRRRLEENHYVSQSVFHSFAIQSKLFSSELVGNHLNRNNFQERREVQVFGEDLEQYSNLNRDQNLEELKNNFDTRMETIRTPLNILTKNQSNVQYYQKSLQQDYYGDLKFSDVSGVDTIHNNIHSIQSVHPVHGENHGLNNTIGVEDKSFGMLNQSFSSNVNSVNDFGIRKKDTIPTTSDGHPLGIEQRMPFFSPKGVKLRKLAEEKSILVKEDGTENAYQKELRRVLGFVHEKQKTVVSSPRKANILVVGNDAFNNSFSKVVSLPENKDQNNRDILMNEMTIFQFDSSTSNFKSLNPSQKEKTDLEDQYNLSRISSNIYRRIHSPSGQNSTIQTEQGFTPIREAKNRHGKRRRVQDFTNIGKKYTRML